MKRAVSAPKMGSFWWVQNGSYFGGRFGPRLLGHNDPNLRAESAQERGQNQIDRGRFGFREGRFGFPWGSKLPHKKNGPITNGPMKRANLAQLWAINYHTRSCMESTLFTHKARKTVAKALYWYHQDSHHIKEIQNSFWPPGPPLHLSVSAPKWSREPLPQPRCGEGDRPDRPLQQLWFVAVTLCNRSKIVGSY